jgi:hypothetical protein
MFRRHIAGGIGIMMAVTIAEAQLPLPNASLSVTVQQKDEGKVDPGLHVLELICWKGACSLSTVSLNRCGKSGSGKSAFYPKVQYSATSAKSLRVHREGNTLVVQEIGADAGGDYVNNLRFTYEQPREEGMATRLIGFSGGFVKNSLILQRTLTIQYIPLPQAHQVVSLDCGVLLPGLDR